MEGYARIGTLYFLKEPKGSKNLLWSVIENNSNDETSTLEVVEDCLKKGMKLKVKARPYIEKSYCTNFAAIRRYSNRKRKGIYLSSKNKSIFKRFKDNVLKNIN